MNKYLIFGILFIVIVSIFFKNNETFQISENDGKLLNDLVNYIKEDTEYTDYIQWLNSKNNTNLILIEIAIFYQIKTLKKKNKLTVVSIKEIMQESTSSI